MVNAQTLLVALVVVVVLQRGVELWIARRNERWARSLGAVEFGAAHYRWFFVLHPGWLVGTVVEALWRGPETVASWPVWLGSFLAAGVLRYAAIHALGRRWNTRILVLPQTEPIRRGPYRFLDHPNYVAVAIELLSLPMMFGAWVTALVASLFNAVLLLGFRIPCEEAALGAARGPLPPDAGAPEGRGRPPATPGA